MDYYGNNQDAIVPNAGPGHWNDPDMVRSCCSHFFPSFKFSIEYNRDSINISVDHWQLWFELRTIENTVCIVGNNGCTALNVS